MNFEKKTFSFGKSKKQIKDVEPLDYSGIGFTVEKKEDLISFIDEPCLRACEELFDKKIRTVDSGCSKVAPERAYVTIAYDSLDWKNKMLAHKMISDGKALLIQATDENVFRVPESMLEIAVQTNPDDFVDVVSARLCDAIGAFAKQERMIERDINAFRMRVMAFNEKMTKMQQSRS